MIFPAQHVSISIHRPADQVYEFAADPQNVPQWAAGLGRSIQHINGEWVAESPMGTVKVKFAAQNPFGILDHDVTLPSGVTVRNLMRVFPNHEGSEVIFTVFRQPGVSEQQFAKDVQAVRKDLETLKRLLEQ